MTLGPRTPNRRCRLLGSDRKDMRNRGLEDNAELVSRWMLSQLRLDRMRAER